MNYKSVRKVLSVIAVFLMVLMMTASVFYIAEETEHDCCGEECPVCECIHICESILNHTQIKVVFDSAVVFIISAALCETAICSGFASDTLVSYKVRLDS